MQFFRNLLPIDATNIINASLLFVESVMKDDLKDLIPKLQLLKKGRKVSIWQRQSKYIIARQFPRNGKYFSPLTNHGSHDYLCRWIRSIVVCYILDVSSMESKFFPFDSNVRLNVIHDRDVEESEDGLLLDEQDDICSAAER